MVVFGFFLTLPCWRTRFTARRENAGFTGISAVADREDRASGGKTAIA